jgi:hypothetical protein
MVTSKWKNALLSSNCRFLDGLDVPAQRIPLDPDAQAALYRSKLAGR